MTKHGRASGGEGKGAGRESGQWPEPPRCRVYLVSPPAIDLDAFARGLESALEGGDVAAFQLRLKPASDDEIVAAARRLMPICHAHDVAFIVNDRPDIAARLGAEGVHLGQSDMEVRAARALLGDACDIGVTCHASRHLAYEAGAAGADYVAFGAFFASPTKDSGHRAEPELLRVWSETTEIPSVAIGGITADNCAPLVAAGADFLAVSSFVWRHPDGPARAVTELNAAIKEALATG